MLSHSLTEKKETSLIMLMPIWKMSFRNWMYTFLDDLGIQSDKGMFISQKEMLSVNQSISN